MFKNLIFKTMLKISKIILVSWLCCSVITETVSAQNVPDLKGESAPNRIKISECIADVKEVTSWDVNSTQEAAQNLCNLRKKHAQSRKFFLTTISKLNAEYKDHTNHGLNAHLPTAIAAATNIVKSCIDFKEGFTYPHNIGLLIVPELIRIDCYKLGADFVNKEIAK
jgi:hypothetical protein